MKPLWYLATLFMKQDLLLSPVDILTPQHLLPVLLLESTGTGKVYYLNFKPEQADDWKNLAAKYTEETGVQVDVETAASGTYED